EPFECLVDRATDEVVAVTEGRWRLTARPARRTVGPLDTVPIEYRVENAGDEPAPVTVRMTTGSATAELLAREVAPGEVATGTAEVTAEAEPGRMLVRVELEVGPYGRRHQVTTWVAVRGQPP